MANTVNCTTKETKKRDKMLIPFLKSNYVVDPTKGEIYSKFTNRRIGKPRDKNSYGGICPVIDGVKYFVNTHRVIWLVCKGLVPVGYTINHIDSDRSNSKLKNLECITASENQKHAYKFGFKVSKPLKGCKNPNACFTETQVKEIRSRFKGKKKSKKNFITAGNYYNVSYETIRKIVLHRSYT